MTVATLTYREVDERYADLKRQYAAGTLTVDAFDKALKDMMVQDGQGRWWAKSRETGAWSYHDGTTWVPGTPPDYAPATPIMGSMPPSVSYGAPTGPGTAAALYVLSFLIPIAALVIYFIYKGKPAASDRQIANIAAMVGLAGLAFWLVVSQA